MAAAARAVTTIKGYVVVLPGRNDDDSDLDESDDDNDWPDFGEMSAMASGGAYVSFSRPKKIRVTIKNIEPPMSQYICEGQLHLTEPWWLISAQAKNRGRVNYINGYPSYQLRTDAYVTTHKLVTQFLTTVGRIADNEIDPVVNELLNYIEQNGLEKGLNFQNLEDAVDSFLGSLDEVERVAYRKSLSSTVWMSEEGQAVYFAIHYPQLFKMASQLLPCHFLKLAEKARYMDAEKLQMLEKATASSLWVFGFKQILYREYGVMGMEAQLRFWVNSGLIQTLPPVQKDAIYIYNALKLHAKKRGHTYVKESDLRNKSSDFLEKHVVRNWKDALEFLDANAVIVRETESDHVKVFLKSNWYAEKDTAKAFAEVLENGVKDPIEWDVDVDSEDFVKVRTDEDQWTAVHLMCNSPITVLSGKGGCGKTSVVTTLLSHACVRSGVLEDKSSTEDIDDDDEEDHNTNRTPSMDRTRHHHHLANRSTANLTQTENEAITKDGNQDEEETYLSKTNLGSKILLTAPTGKAAILLGRKAKLKSCTLHSVIMSFKMYCLNQNRKKNDKAKDGGSSDDENTSWTHENKEVLVVDECSLVSVSTFSTVINILLKECNLKKIILLGDVRQLPSIEPGNFLGDVFTVLAPLGFSIELRTNHRAESELIVQNATWISLQSNPMFDSARRFHLMQPHEQDQQGRDDVVRSLLHRAEDIQDHTTSQFVAFTRKDCEAVNELCCRHYNKHSLKTSKGKWDFRPGDKVCMTKNGIISNHIVKKYKSKKEREEEAKVEDGKMDEKLSQHLTDRKPFKDKNTPVKRNLCFELDGVATSGQNRLLARNSSSGQQTRNLTTEYYSQSEAGTSHGMTNLKKRENSASGSCHGDCGAADSSLNNSQDETSASSQPYADTLDDLINVAHNQDEDEFDNCNDANVKAHLNRTDVSTVLDDFFELEDSQISKTQRNRHTLKKKNVSTTESASGDIEGVSQLPLVVKPAPKDPEEEIDAQTPDHMITRKDVKLCNGEIFFVEREFSKGNNENKMRTYLSLCDRDEERPRSVCVEYRQLMKHCKMRHAWVRTIHTFQGSESQSVVYILGNIFYENWQHVYTAITRGRCSVYVVGNPVSLNKTITRKVFSRMTTLNVKLLDHLRPRENMVQDCVQKIAASLKNNTREQGNGDNPTSPSEDNRSLFDSDDSWMCNVSDIPELNLDGSVIDSGAHQDTVSVPLPKSDGSYLPSGPQPTATDTQQLGYKRQRSQDESIFMSPPKSQKPSESKIAVTPVRSSLNSLSLNCLQDSDEDLL